MKTDMKHADTKPTRPAEILHEHAVCDDQVHGVTFDGERVWFVHGKAGEVSAFDPKQGRVIRSFNVRGASAGAAFDGKHLWIAAGAEIHRVDPESGKVLGTIPAPDDDVSGLAYHDGALWAGAYRGRLIRKLDPKTGAVLRTLKSDRLVTGVSWAGDELWHGSVDASTDAADVRRVDARTGDVELSMTLPRDAFVSGVETDGDGRIWCGDHGKLRAIKRPTA